MSLATRCPSCGTVFRVVQDQLRISEGWVRCGRCNGVFDATEVLFDIDLGTPVRLELDLPARPPGALPAQPLPHAALDEDALPAGPLPRAPLADHAGTVPAGPPAPLTITDWDGPQPGRAAAEAAATRGRPWADPIPASPGGGLRADPDFGTSLLRAPSADGAGDEDEIRIVDALPAPGQVPAPGPAEPPRAEGPAAVAAEDLAPTFLRAADRAAWWRRPAVRAGLTAGVAALAASALLQAALLERDLLAARAPATAPLLQALCRPFGCQVQAPRRIDALTVESSQLGRLEAPGQYRLQLALRNRADIALLAPALELSLTDGQGRLVVRRVLQVQDLGLAASTLPPGQAVTLQAILSAGDQRIDGYAVELFYP